MLVLTVSLVCAAVGGLLAYRSVPPRPQTSQPPATIYHNFGQARAGSSVHVKCTIENVRPQPVEVKDIVTSCGCTTPGHRPKRIEANGKSEMPVEVQLARSDDGPFASKVTVFFKNDVPPLTFVIQGHVLRQYPPEVDFGAVKRDDQPRRTLVVKSMSLAQPLKILGMQYDERRFSVQHGRSGASGLDAEVTVEAKRDMAEGPFSSAVRLQTDDATEPIKEITLKGTVLRPIETDSKALSFGLVGPGEEKRAALRVFSPYGKSFEIEAVTAEPKVLLEVRSIEPDKGADAAMVNLALRGPLPEKLLKGRVTVAVRCNGQAYTVGVDVFAMDSSARVSPPSATPSTSRTDRPPK
jgi:hypothetical protein